MPLRCAAATCGTVTSPPRRPSIEPNNHTNLRLLPTMVRCPPCHQGDWNRASMKQVGGRNCHALPCCVKRQAQKSRRPLPPSAEDLAERGKEAARRSIPQTREVNADLPPGRPTCSSPPAGPCPPSRTDASCHKRSGPCPPVRGDGRRTSAAARRAAAVS